MARKKSQNSLLVQRTQFNVRDYGISKIVFDEKPHIKRDCKHFIFASHIICPEFNGIIDMIDILVLQNCFQTFCFA